MDEATQSFRIVVLSEVLGRAEYSATPEPLLDALRIDRLTLDDVMRACQVTVSLEVPDPFGLPRALRLAPLRFDALKAFKASAIVEQVSELRGLSAAYGLLRDLERGRRSLSDVLPQIGRALGNEEWAARIVTRLTSPSTASVSSRAEAPARETGVQRMAPTPFGLDALLDMVELPGTDRSTATQPVSAPKSPLEGVISALNAPKSGQARADAEAARSALQSAFSHLLRSVLHHPEVLRLERAWAGLRLLVEHNDPKSGAELDLIPTRPDTVLSALEGLAAGSAAERARSSIDLLVVDYEVDDSARDRALLQSWGQVAETLRAPLLTGASPRLIGVDSLDALSRSRKTLKNSAETWAVGLRALAARPEARWLLLMLNGMLVRTRKEAETFGAGELPYTESPPEPTCFAAAPLAGALVALRSVAEHGHPWSLPGSHTGPAVISNLMVHDVGPDSARTAIALEVPLDGEILSELGRVGINALATVRNRDRAVVNDLRMLWRAPGPADTDATLRLVDQLFVGRTARAVEQLGAAIPEHTATRAVEEVATLTMSELFADGAPPGPELSIAVAGTPRRLAVTVKPRRYYGVSLEEIRFETALGGL